MRMKVRDIREIDPNYRPKVRKIGEVEVGDVPSRTIQDRINDGSTLPPERDENRLQTTTSTKEG